MTIGIRCGEVISLRAGYGRTKGIVDTVVASSLYGPGSISTPWMADTGRKTAAPRALTAGSALLGDDIDHPAHGIGAVLRRMRALGNFNTVDGTQRNVRKRSCSGCRRRRAHTIDENNRLLGRHATHVNVRRRALPAIRLYGDTAIGLQQRWEIGSSRPFDIG